MTSDVTYHKLQCFLESRRCQTGSDVPASHTTFNGGKFYIQDHDLDQFYFLYNAVLRKNQSKLHFVEQHRHSYCPIIMDFDFKQDSLERRYTKTHITSFLKKLYVLLDEYIVIPPTPVEVFIMEKPPRPHPKQDNVYKDGIHLFIPSIVTHPRFQLFIRERLMDDLKNILEPCGFLNKIEEIYDKSVLHKNGWIMYGSNKTNEDNKWTVTQMYMFDKDGNLNQVDNIKDHYNDETDFVELFSIRNKCNETPERLPYTLKDDPFSRQPSICIESSAIQSTAKESFVTDNCDTHSYDYIKQHVDMLKDSRADSYDDWMGVGWCLHNINPEFLPLWVEFSERSQKYKPGQCEQLWHKMKTRDSGGLTVASLFYWAKQDSPEQYAECHKNMIGKLVYKSRSQTHYSIACVAYELYKDMFAVVSFDQKDIYYIYQNHRWQQDSNFYGLRTKLSKELPVLYSRYAASASVKCAQATSENDVKKYSDLAASYNAINRSLEMTQFQKQVMVQCTMLFIKSKSFYDQLDSKVNLIGFENGVYDLDKCEFRNGRPDDLITFTTGYNYVDEMDEEIIQFVHNFIRDISANEGVSQFLLDLISYSLHGNRRFQDSNLCFFAGSGANAKSLFKTLVVETFGNLSYEPNVSLITIPSKDSSRANPEMAKLKGKRFVCMAEPEQAMKIQIGLVKPITGQDRIQARELFKPNIEFKPQCIMVICMNNKPALSDFDEGFCRRLNIVEFPFKFVAEPMLPHEKLIDPTLEDKFTNDVRYRQAFMKILIDNYHDRIANANRIVKPIEVVEETTQYLGDNNVVKNFIDAKLEITLQKEDMMSASEMFNLFKTSEYYNGKDNRWFKERMSACGYKSEKKTNRGQFYNCFVYYGIKARNIEPMFCCVDDIDNS